VNDRRLTGGGRANLRRPAEEPSCRHLKFLDISRSHCYNVSLSILGGRNMLKAAPSLKQGIRFKKRIRRGLRRPIIGNVLFTHPFTKTEQPYLKGITADVSTGGACIRTYYSLPVGLAMTLHGRVLGDEPRRAEVVWCQEETAGIFRAGLAFL
jgi:hypothetical protein